MTIMVDEQNPDGRALQQSDMHLIDRVFAVRYVSGGSNGLIELYVEDDESYHLKATFDRYWLPNLVNLAKMAQDKYGLKKDE